MLRGRTIMTLSVLVLGGMLSLCWFSNVFAQDPGVPDSLIIGNLNRTPILAGLNSRVVVPVYAKTDDSVTFAHIPVATDNNYVATRDSGAFFPPMSLWDLKLFMQPDQNSPTVGYTSQSIVGFAYLSDPRDPQNFLMTNGQWVHIANFFLYTTNDINALGDTMHFAAGFNPANGGLLMGLSDGTSEIHPLVVWGSLYFPPNTPPVFTEPVADTIPLNEQFGICFNVTATDADTNNLVLTADFGPTDYTFTQIQNIPGRISYRFCWSPSAGSAGTYPLSFTVNDGNGGVVTRDIVFVVSPAGLSIGNISALPGSTISLPVSLENPGRTSTVGGFEILVNWNTTALTLNGITRGGRTGSFEYFRVNNGDAGEGTSRITGIADIRNGVVSPPLQPGNGPIFFLEFSVSPDESMIGVDLPVIFLNLDQTDNTLSDSTGYLLVHPNLTNGLVSIIGPDDFITGDINLNGVPYEIADVVLYVNHLTDNIGFPFNPIQVEASDVNADGIPETVADLVYLINIVAGIIQPPGKLEPIDANAIVALIDQNGSTDFRLDSPVEMGAVLLSISHPQGREIIPTSDGPFTLSYHDNGNTLTVLAYLPQGGGVSSGNTKLFTLTGNYTDQSISEMSSSDSRGHLVNISSRLEAPIPSSFELSQNYPNPFNSSTFIKFGLPTEGDVRLDVFNLVGQKVTTLIDSRLSPGWHNLIWNGTNDRGEIVTSGIYYYRLVTADNTQIMKMTLLK